MRDEADAFVAEVDRKMRGLQSRSPVFFTFVADPMTLGVDGEGGTPHGEIPMDRGLQPGTVVRMALDWLRSNCYPKATRRVEGSPSPEKVADYEFSHPDVSFDEAYEAVKADCVSLETYVVDKIDNRSNRIVLVRDLGGGQVDTEVYEMAVPVMQFARKWCVGDSALLPETLYAKIVSSSKALVSKYTSDSGVVGDR